MNQDTLSDVLRTVHLRGSLYFHVRGTREWAAEAPPSRDIADAVMPGSEHVMEFHVVLSGACWAAAVGGEPVHLAAGDLVIFAHGDAHVISSAPGMRARPNAEGYFERQGQRVPFRLHSMLARSMSGPSQLRRATPCWSADSSAATCGPLIR